MDDIELQNLFKRLGKTILILLVFISFFVIVLVTKFASTDTKIIKAVKNKEDAIIFLRKTDCSNCKEIKSELKKSNIEYIEVKTDTENYYDTFLKELNLSENDIVEPTIINMKQGEAVSIYIDINDTSELREYLNNIG